MAAAVEVPKSVVQAQDEAAAQKNLMDPFEFLQTYAGAPTKATIDQWKAQAPNGIVRILALGKRVFILRGIGALELQTVQAEIPENTGAGLNPEARAAKIEAEVSLRVGSRCVLWTSSTTDHKLTVEQLRVGSAGLPSTLFSLITYLSDFVDPQELQLVSAEL